MTKNLRQLREKAATKGPSAKLKELIPPADNTVATQRFIKKHVVAHHDDPAGNGDDVYKASNIKTVNRSPDHGYNPGEDEKVYEEVELTEPQIENHPEVKEWAAALKDKHKSDDIGFIRKENKIHAYLNGKLLDSLAIKVAESYEQIDERRGYSAKRARAGKDIGKPGKQFKRIAARAARKYGSVEAGERVAGAVLKKLREADTYEQKLKDERSREAKELFVKQKAIRAKYDAMNRKNTVLGRMLSALGLRKEEEDLLANLYNTLDEQNKALMLNLLDSEEGINNLIEFAIEKGID